MKDADKRRKEKKIKNVEKSSLEGTPVTETKKELALRILSALSAETTACSVTLSSRTRSLAALWGISLRERWETNERIRIAEEIIAELTTLWPKLGD